MTFPQPPWNLFGVYRQSERQQLLTELGRSTLTKFEIRFEPAEAKPYCLWVHDDELQLALDSLFRKQR